MNKFLSILFLLSVCLFLSCKREEAPGEEISSDKVYGKSANGPTPYTLKIPLGFPVMKMTAGNPLTVEGVELGRKLFFDKMLSADNSIACAGCHFTEHSFSDNVAFSKGVNGALGTRNAMPLFNLGWSQTVNNRHAFMWDGGVPDLENQVLLPLQNPVEMNESLVNIEKKLRADALYRQMFKGAFGIDSITIKYVMFAIAQYERTLISATSKWDLVKAGKAQFTESEKRGEQVFSLDSKAGCMHCHNVPFFTNFKFHNNGLDSIPADLGLGAITGNANENGLFKVPSLRNLAFTGPYMHDGRFTTIEEIIEFYDHGVKNGPTTDGNLKGHINEGGLKLTAQDKKDLLAFLNTLNDYQFVGKHGIIAGKPISSKDFK